MERERMVDIEKQFSIEAENELYVARFVGEKMHWGLGSIEAQDFTDVEKGEIAQRAIDSLIQVDEAQMPYSGCTDGRLRLRLGDGSAAPVREKLVGADTVTAFHMAEALGSVFYGKLDTAPLADRVRFVTDFLVQSGLKPSTHGPSCGAAASYPVIVENAIRLHETPGFTERQRLLLPEYNTDIQKRNIERYSQRLSKGLYDDWSEDLIRSAVLDTTGQKGVKELLDDGKGVHGHTEVLIARIKPRGVTLGATLFAAQMGGLEVFTVNDARQQHLAQLFGRGDLAEQDYLTAINASEDFQDAGHATLSRNLETLVIEQKAA
jgi:hypothetical protein